MPSSNKTSFLGLNLFVGSDKPKMEDVNFDNNQLDQRCREHFEDSEAHITAEEREKWNAAGSGGSGLELTSGSYTGNGQNTQSVQLGFTPKLLLVFAQGEVLALLEGGMGVTTQYMGILTPEGGTFGISSEENGFRVHQTSGSPGDGRKSGLNASGVTYRYLAFS